MEKNKAVDFIKGIGGFLIMMYIPLLIGLIWSENTGMMIKILATNSILILGVWMIIQGLEHE